MKKLKLVLAALYIMVQGCSPKVNNGEETIVVDDNEAKVELSEISSEFGTIQLESTSPLIGQVRQAYFTSERILIFDNMQQSIFGFNISGEFLYRINNVGSGPLEYESITDIAINSKNQIEVYSLRQGKIISFSLLNGNPLREKRFPFYAREFTALHDGGYLIYAPDIENQTHNGRKVPTSLFTVSADLELKEIIEEYQIEEYDEPLNVLSGSTVSSILFSPFSQKLWEVDKEGASNSINVKLNKNLDPKFYAMPLSISGNKQTKMIDIGLPNGNVKSIIFHKNRLIHNYGSIVNNLFTFPIRPQFVSNDGRLVDIISYERKVMTDEFLKNSPVLSRDSSYININNKINTLTTNSNPIILWLKLNN